MVVGPDPFPTPHRWALGEEPMETASSLDILGVTFIINSTGDAISHVESRIKKCRGAFYSLGCAGMSFPGTSADVKTCLWNSVCVPSLTYGLDLLPLSKRAMDKMESVQGSLVKQAFGISKRSHHSKLLEALNIKTIRQRVRDTTLSLF